MHMIVDSLGVRHIFEHHIAYLKRRLSEADLEKLDCPDLV